jgi:hypothetical protein
MAELPDFAKIHEEVARKGGTQELRWEYYKLGCVKRRQSATR